MNCIVVGNGRMGQAIDAAARARGHDVIARVARLTPGAALGFDGADAAFEFTAGEAAEGHVIALLARGIPTVCGTTGWRPTPALDAVLAGAPAGLIVEPNFAIGMRLFFRIVERAAELAAGLGLHEPWVHEAHHRGKRDAPSGTAKALAERIVAADPRLTAIHAGLPDGALPRELLPVTSTRAGSEPGTHWVGFDGEHDAITLRHSARGRGGFALGAVLAAEWLVGRSGRHGFDEVLDDLLARGTRRDEGEGR